MLERLSPQQQHHAPVSVKILRTCRQHMQCRWAAPFAQAGREGFSPLHFLLAYNFCEMIHPLLPSDITSRLPSPGPFYPALLWNPERFHFNTHALLLHAEPICDSPFMCAMLIPGSVYLGANTRSEMHTHFETQTLPFVLYLLINPHCS